MGVSKWDVLNEEQRYFYIGIEKDYEKFIVNNIEDICDGLNLPKIETIKQQPRYNLEMFSIRPDIIVYHVDGTYSVFEIKCSRNKYPSEGAYNQAQAIGQLLLYKSVLKEINGASPRMFLVDQKIYTRTVCVFSEMQLPITLIEVQGNRVFIPYMNHKE